MVPDRLGMPDDGYSKNRDFLNIQIQPESNAKVKEWSY